MSDQVTFWVNGNEITTDQDKSLIRFLRDDLHLNSVKDGCSQGACGTCTVVVDGKAKRACVLKLQKLDGKHITTVEGLTDAEKEAFVYSFGVKGAVQCGFCTPGMVMSAKALLDETLNPTEEEIKKAIKNNLCRCTGYKKIIEAIELCAAILRGDEKIDETLEMGEFEVGSGAFRVDVRRKVLGQNGYVDDIYSDDMVYGSAVRSEYARARIVDIDTSEAEKVEGVVGILTAEDVPVNKVGHLQQDWDVLIAKGAITHCCGDAIVLVCAETQEALEKAKSLVKIEYEELPCVHNMEEAAAEDAPLVHSAGNLCQERHVVRGDAATALANSAYVVTETFETPFTEHAFLEPECAVAEPYKNGVKIYTTDQSAFDTRHETAHMFGWDDEPERIVVENMYVGGGFGGKEDVSTQHIAALMAYKFNRMVKVKFTRDESIRFHPKRHASKSTFTLGCDENGKFTGLDCLIQFDTGGYASLCGPVLERACTHAPGPYTYQNTDIRGYGWYTNNPPGGAFRGFGVCQSEFALECTIDLLAEKAGLDPWEIRYRNAIEPGAVLPNGQIADCSTALKETLLAVKDAYYANKDHAGIACAMKNTGVGVGIPDKGRCNLVVRDGMVTIQCGATDIGQGAMTIFTQMAVSATGLPRDKFILEMPNTETSPNSGTTSGSRQTLVSGEAVRGAGLKLKEALDEANGNLEALEGQEFFYEFFDPTDRLGSDLPNPKSHIAYGYATACCVLDDEGYVTDVYQAHDSGKVINPIAIQGQIEGGILMSMGYALTEQYDLKDCIPTNKYGTLGLMKADQIPDIHAIYVEKDELLDFAYGSKGIGEIASIPMAQAIAGAYYALDGKMRTKMPLEDTPYEKKKKAKKLTPEQIARIQAAKAKKAEKSE